jgi:hypothetical protein
LIDGAAALPETIAGIQVQVDRIPFPVGQGPFEEQELHEIAIGRHRSHLQRTGT